MAEENENDVGGVEEEVFTVAQFCVFKGGRLRNFLAIYYLHSFNFKPG